jgi:NADH-quinone oxidoreductase subunit D
MPYSVYPEFDFEIPIGRGEWGATGDSMDRYMMRIREMVQSARILRQALTQIPEGPVLAKVVRNFRPPAGECQVRVESARGDQGWYVVSDGSAYPWRVRVRTGSFAAMGMIQKLSRGLMIADLVVLIASLDVIAPEIDR